MQKGVGRAYIYLCSEHWREVTHAFLSIFRVKERIIRGGAQQPPSTSYVGYVMGAPGSDSMMVGEQLGGRRPTFSQIPSFTISLSTAMGKFRTYSAAREPARISNYNLQVAQFAGGANRYSANQKLSSSSPSPLLPSPNHNPPSISVRSQPMSTGSVWVSLRK